VVQVIKDHRRKGGGDASISVDRIKREFVSAKVNMSAQVANPEPLIQMNISFIINRRPSVLSFFTEHTIQHV
jgi:hypothetical protein